MHAIIHKMHAFVDRINIFSKESIGAAFGRAPQGRGAPLWLFSLLTIVILCINMCILCVVRRILYVFYIFWRIILNNSLCLPIHPLNGAYEI